MGMIRPSTWIARPPLAATRPKQTWQMTQGNVGAPIIQDRLFLFANYEFNPYENVTPVTIAPAALAAPNWGQALIIGGRRRDTGGCQRMRVLAREV